MTENEINIKCAVNYIDEVLETSKHIFIDEQYRTEARAIENYLDKAKCLLNIVLKGTRNGTKKSNM